MIHLNDGHCWYIYHSLVDSLTFIASHHLPNAQFFERKKKIPIEWSVTRPCRIMPHTHMNNCSSKPLSSSNTAKGVVVIASRNVQIAPIALFSIHLSSRFFLKIWAFQRYTRSLPILAWFSGCFYFSILLQSDGTWWYRNMPQFA
jgi:hypothetical protein